MSLDAVLDTVAAGCLVAGAMLCLAAGVALLRFPDLLFRLHAAAKPQVLGLLLVLLGCALRLRNGVDITTLVLIGLFQLASAPVAAHMVGRTAYPHRDIGRDLLITDELAPDWERINANRGVPSPPAQASQGPG
ncbi:monovalent cation/H(+) antiporter subunit G [Micromonospora sp. HK10]|uniref:monovalent cation/H(+) antiporter subunit G n=1 Tax=Micromonospora sp. HK10 TaxID=1538294 RepID=UPI000626FB50|nr:monovalent cation/H(+) antiporter subunit G [Micromonospora sp. HK10]KKJ93716.1 cation:proton antiporter [Micromonospora sp. HK10]